MRILTASLMLLAFLGCKSGESDMGDRSWTKKLGQEVTLEGIAEDEKLGAVLVMDEHMIWIDGMDSWPTAVRKNHVVVKGKVIERYDLPVFEQKKDEPIKSGIPVPEGTDLHKASHRYLIANATWQLKE